jgi:ribosomal protein L20
MLADLAMNQPEGFAVIAKQAKAALDKAEKADKAA